MLSKGITHISLTIKQTTSSIEEHDFHWLKNMSYPNSSIIRVHTKNLT